jgi:Sulfotransferase domain
MTCAVNNETPDWALIFDGYAAAVDWPTAAFYDQLADVYPEAIVLLSTRENADAWWRSANATIFQVIDKVSGEPPELERMIMDLFNTQFTPAWRDRDASIAAYLRHNEAVRSRVPADRLVEWTAGDGWAPICLALGVAEPDDPFPHVNTTAQFRAMTGLD